MTGLEAPVLAALITAGAGIGTTTAGIIANRGSKPKAPEPSPRLQMVAGEDSILTPGQRVNAINTSPQGLLETPSTGRRTLLGG